MVKVILATTLLAATLAGCATSQGNFCDVASPRRPSKAQIAVMSDEAKREDLAFNRFGAAHCGWKP
ncbi:hypothetical protein [Methylobacterium sp. D48H]